MSPSQRLLEFIDQRAKTLGFENVDGNRDLFESGILDSFSLVDLILLVESEYALRVPDSDVHPANFRTIVKIERYLRVHGA
jgi:acyl carrier protein